LPAAQHGVGLAIHETAVAGGEDEVGGAKQPVGIVRRHGQRGPIDRQGAWGETEGVICRAQGALGRRNGVSANAAGAGGGCGQARTAAQHSVGLAIHETAVPGGKGGIGGTIHPVGVVGRDGQRGLIDRQRALGCGDRVSVNAAGATRRARRLLLFSLMHAIFPSP